MWRLLGVLVVVLAGCGGGGGATTTRSTTTTVATVRTTTTAITQPAPTTTRPPVDHEAWPALLAYYEARQEAVRRKDPTDITQFLDLREVPDNKIERSVADDIC